MSMSEEEKKKIDEKVRKNERKEKNIHIEDWDLDKIILKLDSPKEKKRLTPILKEMKEDLMPKPILFYRNQEDCQVEYLKNVAKFNIMAMNKFYLDMDHITICISGFLTEKQEHFSGWKEFVRNNNQITFYYFLNWPSESGLSSFLYFNTVKKRANYFGKLLANMIVSEKFFKNKKITLVGHSLGCHFIKCCIKEMAENKDEDFQGQVNKIDKIIFLGGATQIKNKKRWVDIFKKVTKCNIYNFYSNKDKALRIMQSWIVWGKKSIGRHPLLIEGIHVQNFDCSGVEFEDTLNHGYKQIYGKLIKYFGL
jgi:esterase/lipase superfamily enzyme